MSRNRDRLPDWFVGGAGKRRLMSALVEGGTRRRWTEDELADAAGLGKKNSVPRHVAVLRQARLLTGPPGAYRLNGRSPLLEPLTAFLAVLEEQVKAEELPESRGGTTRDTPK